MQKKQENCPHISPELWEAEDMGLPDEKCSTWKISVQTPHSSKASTGLFASLILEITDLVGEEL